MAGAHRCFFSRTPVWGLPGWFIEHLGIVPVYDRVRCVSTPATSSARPSSRRSLAFYASLAERKGEYAAFEAGSHVLLSSVAGRRGSGIPASEGPVEAEQAMGILRRILAEGYRAPSTTSRPWSLSAPGPTSGS